MSKYLFRHAVNTLICLNYLQLLWVEEGSQRAVKLWNVCLEVEPRNVNFVLSDSMCNQRKITLIEFLVYSVERGPIRGKLPWIPL
jgi:hypothetical protein